MKTFFKPFLAGWIGMLHVGLFNAPAVLEVSASLAIHATADFHQPLAAHGAWIEVGSYGRCWRPARVAADWRPYCYGSWVWTDCGWYWVSDEPWAWACYHYGWWVYDPVQAWIWVPGVEWAPAWVAWRVGGGYCGWAPLPPHGVVVAPSLFAFVELHRFHEPVRPSKVIVNNTTIINKTTVINNIKRESRTVAASGPQKVVINEGPGVDVIQKATARKINEVPIREAARQTPDPPGMAREASEPLRKEKDNPPGVQEQPKSTPPQRSAPAPERPARPVAPDESHPPSKIEPAPLPPPAPHGPPGKPPRTPKGKEGNKGHEKDKP